jgi:hypothetical protein
MLKTGHLAPVWKVDDFVHLRYRYDTPYDTGNRGLIEQYMAAGHSFYNMSMYNCFETEVLPTVVAEYIKPEFSHLGNLSVAVNMFRPGQYLPYHVDRFEKYRKVNNIVDEKIVRVILMLEDSKPGQISQVGSVVTGSWLAGDWFQWDADDYHTFYNLSLYDRYAVQLTGTL